MESIKIKIANAKDYQIKACAHSMRKALVNATDNLTGSITDDILHMCRAELKKRGISEEY